MIFKSSSWKWDSVPGGLCARTIQICRLRSRRRITKFPVHTWFIKITSLKAQVQVASICALSYFWAILFQPEGLILIQCPSLSLHSHKQECYIFSRGMRALVTYPLPPLHTRPSSVCPTSLLMYAEQEWCNFSAMWAVMVRLSLLQRPQESCSEASNTVHCD